MAHAGRRQRINEEIGTARGHGSRILPRSAVSNRRHRHRSGPSLLGAVTLEELGLAVDPAARRLARQPAL
jgi:hypothetical protein